MPNGKSRVTLQFNEYDFRHKKVLETLRARPRSMTELVVNAVMHYITCPDAGNELNRGAIREVVIEVIQEMQANGTLNLSSPSSPTLAADDMSTLGDVMSMFRGSE